MVLLKKSIKLPYGLLNKSQYFNKNFTRFQSSLGNGSQNASAGSNEPFLSTIIKKRSIQIGLGLIGLSSFYYILAKRNSEPANKGEIKGVEDERFPKRSNVKDLKLISLKEVETLLTQNEEKVKVADNLTAYVNNVASNNPIEDAHFLHFDKTNQLVVFGIIDGHAGFKCSRYLKEQIPNWLMDKVISKMATWNKNDNYVNKVSEGITNTLLQLDHYFVNQRIYTQTGELNLENVDAAYNGAVAIVGILDLKNKDLFVANVGDCRGVLGRLKKSNNWETVELSEDHTFLNLKELARVIKDHPLEGATIGWRDRYMATLQPTRAFGDAWLKWPRDFQTSLLDIMPQGFKLRNVPDYHTPPYPTALAEVTHTKLTKEDKFIVFGCDGLFDSLESKEVVHLVGGSLLNDAIQHKDYRIFKDSNLATHLIRNSFRGWNDQYIQALLSLTYPQSRRHRDDVSVMVLVLE
jgi:pyruvate dehydrogenase phosphatase